MKNRACCWILIVFGALCLIMVVSGVLLVGSLVSFGPKRVVVQPGSFLVLELSGRLSEHTASPRDELFGFRRTPTLSKILTALERAADDPKIAGVILKPSFLSGFADIREIREALLRFRQTGRPVYAYLEIGTDRDYYLASVADTIAMNPAKSGGIVMMGMGISNTYLKDTFEKVGLKFHVLHVGDYKGAYENLGRNSMSEPLRASLQALLDDMFETYVSEIAESRSGLDSAGLEQTLWKGDRYLLTGAEAKEHGLVDIVTDWGDFEIRINASDKAKRVSLSDYARSGPRPNAAADALAVVFAEGEITYGSEEGWNFPSEEGVGDEKMVTLLKKLREDERTKAVVLRVNSPGGSALASDIILAELRRLRAEKPVVVSLGNIAASGGYYIACNADRIVAQPNTITGSIGVVGVIATAEGLYRKIGARIETVERGKWANFFRPDRGFSDDQQKVLMSLMQGVYDEFVGHVAEGRKLSVEDVDRVAEGRIWSGRQALERKLIDELGGLDLAVQRACELAKLDPERVAVRYYPEHKDLFTLIIDRLSNLTRVFLDQWFVSPEEIEIRRAVAYALRFVRNREFVQAWAPVEGIE